MITAHRCVIGRAGAGVEHGVSGERARRIDPFLAQYFDRREDEVDLLAADRAAFTGVRVEAGKGEPRIDDVEIPCQPAGGDARPRYDQFDREQAR